MPRPGPARPRATRIAATFALVSITLVVSSSRADEQTAAASAADPTGVIRLPEAVSAALEASPELASFSWELRAREAREVQAALRPNPGLSLEVEDVGGRGEVRGFSGSQTTLQLGQLIELGGKRGTRMRAARLEREVAGIDYEARRLDVLAATTQAFVDVLAAQERVRLAEENATLAADLRNAAQRRLRAGISPPVEVSRAAVAESQAEVDLEQARRRLDATRYTLAASWGSTAPRFERAEGDLDRVADTPSFEALSVALAANPDLLRWRSERSQRQASLELARSQAVPDVEVGPGVRWLALPDSAAFLLSASVPLPFLNRNQGAIAEAGSRLAQSSDEERAARVRAARELSSEYQALVSARTQALASRAEILPASREALEQVRKGYLEGRFSQLDVIDAQRTLFASRADYLEAAAAYHRSVAAIERLIAAPLPPAP